MRQLSLLRGATVGAAGVMCCLLPYATRANLDYSFKPGGASAYTYDGFVAAPIQFVTFPGYLKADLVVPFADLSVMTWRASIALSKNLHTPAHWPDASQASPAPNASVQSGRLPGSNGDVLDAPDVLENNVDRIAFNSPVLAPTAFLRFCARYPEDCKVRPTDFEHAVVPLTKSRLAELSKINHDVNHSIRPQENLG